MAEVKSITWFEKYHLALKETLSISEIKKLRDCGQPTAIKIRDEALELCLANDITLDSKGRVPTEMVFEVTGKSLDFYADKMMKEIQAQKLVQGLDYVSA